MANCKFCGRPVLVGKVFHAACWEKQAKEQITEQFCDQYCRFPRECRDDASLAAHCGSCVLARVLNLGL